MNPLPPEAAARLDAARRLLAAGDLHGARAACGQALQVAGEHPDVLEVLLQLALAAGDPDAAERVLRRLGEIEPSPAQEIRLASLLFNRHRHAEVVRIFESLLARNVRLDIERLGAFAFALEKTNDFDRAVNLLTAVYNQAPSGQTATMLVTALMRQMRADLLDRWLPPLMRAHPDAVRLVAAAAEHALMRGDYRQGFALAAQRWSLSGARRDFDWPDCADWDGEPFDGLLLVAMEQGLGEQVLCASMFRDLAKRQGRVLIEADPRLLPLFRRSFPRETHPQIDFVPFGAGGLSAAVAGAADCRRVMALDLGRFFRGDAFAPQTAWLQADADSVAKKRAEYRARFPGRKRVGLSWRSRRLFNGIDEKSLPLQQLAATLSLADVAFIDLQYGEHGDDLAAVAAAGLPLPWTDPCIDPDRDIDAVAAQMCALDAVVTISNTSAHLAGALGLPGIVLLPGRQAVLWYWGYSGESTPWYASLTLLRNPEEQGAAALDGLLAGRLAENLRHG